MISLDLTLMGWIPSSKNTHRVGKGRLRSSAVYAAWKRNAIEQIHAFLADNNEQQPIFAQNIDVSVTIWYYYPERKARVRRKKGEGRNEPLRTKDGKLITSKVNFDVIGIIESVADALQDGGILENDQSIKQVHLYSHCDNSYTIPTVVIQITEDCGIIAQTDPRSQKSHHDLGNLCTVAMPKVMNIGEWHKERRAQDTEGRNMRTPPQKAQCSLCEILIGEGRVETEVYVIWAERFSGKFDDRPQATSPIRDICGSCARDLVAQTRRAHNERIARHNRAIRELDREETHDTHLEDLLIPGIEGRIPDSERLTVPTSTQKAFLNAQHFAEIGAIAIATTREIAEIPWSELFTRRGIVEERLLPIITDVQLTDDERRSAIRATLTSITFEPYTHRPQHQQRRTVHIGGKSNKKEQDRDEQREQPDFGQPDVGEATPKSSTRRVRIGARKRD